MLVTRKSPARRAYELAYRLERQEARENVDPEFYAGTLRELSRCVGSGARLARLNASVSFVDLHYAVFLNRSRGFVKVLGNLYRPMPFRGMHPASRLPGMAPETVRRALFHGADVSIWKSLLVDPAIAAVLPWIR